MKLSSCFLYADFFRKNLEEILFQYNGYLSQYSSVNTVASHIAIDCRSVALKLFGKPTDRMSLPIELVFYHLAYINHSYVKRFSLAAYTHTS